MLSLHSNDSSRSENIDGGELNSDQKNLPLIAISKDSILKNSKKRPEISPSGELFLNQQQNHQKEFNNLEESFFHLKANHFEMLNKFE